MKLKDFSDQFHELHSIYGHKSMEMAKQLKERHKKESEELSEQIDQELLKEIGKLFKTMDLEDKIDFYERYVRREILNPYFEEYEKTALILMDWQYIKVLTNSST